MFKKKSSEATEMVKQPFNIKHDVKLPNVTKCHYSDWSFSHHQLVWSISRTSNLRPGSQVESPCFHSLLIQRVSYIVWFIRWPCVHSLSLEEDSYNEIGETLNHSCFKTFLKKGPTLYYSPRNQWWLSPSENVPINKKILHSRTDLITNTNFKPS